MYISILLNYTFDDNININRVKSNFDGRLQCKKYRQKNMENVSLENLEQAIKERYVKILVNLPVQIYTSEYVGIKI